MNAAYLQPSVRVDPATRIAHVEFDIRNDSQETWRASEGFFIGYHIFDTETGTLLVDGARARPPRDVKASESAHLALDVELPAEDGRYRVYVSPMRENVCWYYEQGWPFLLVEAATENGVAKIRRTRVATSGGLRGENALRAAGRAIVYPVLTLWRNRSLIRVMVRRDVLGRYRGSFGGSLWTILHPLLLMLTYYFVFGVVMRSRFPGDPSRAGFVLYYLAGMLPWLAFSEAVGRSATVLLEHRNFIKKLVFSVETLPVNLVVSGLVTECFAILLFCGFLLVVRHSIPATVFWLPLLLIPQLLLTAGLAWFLAALGAFLRDLGTILGFVLTVWFFATPICYPEDQLPPSATLFLSKNPIYVLVRGYRAILLDHQAPAFGPLWKLWLLSAVVFVIGHAWFYKLRKSFPDVI